MHASFIQFTNIHSVCGAPSLRRVQPFANLWTIACQDPLSMGSSRQEHWSGLPFLPPKDLPDPGIEPASPALAGGFFTTVPPGYTIYKYCEDNKDRFLFWVKYLDL